MISGMFKERLRKSRRKPLRDQIQTQLCPPAKPSLNSPAKRLFSPLGDRWPIKPQQKEEQRQCTREQCLRINHKKRKVRRCSDYMFQVFTGSAPHQNWKHVFDVRRSLRTFSTNGEPESILLHIRPPAKPCRKSMETTLCKGLSVKQQGSFMRNLESPPYKWRLEWRLETLQVKYNIIQHVDFCCVVSRWLLCQICAVSACTQFSKRNQHLSLWLLVAHYFIPKHHSTLINLRCKGSNNSNSALGHLAEISQMDTAKYI